MLHKQPSFGASAWRRATCCTLAVMMITLGAASPLGAATLFVENWQAYSADEVLPDNNDWTKWGEPKPKIAQLPGSAEKALDPDGDSWCDSGVYSTTGFDLSTGFKLSFDVNTLAGANDVRSNWDQTISVGLAALNLSSNAPCNYQNEPENLIDVRLTSHLAPGVPPADRKGQAITIEGRALLADDKGPLVTFEPGMQDYGPEYDKVWYTYTIEATIPSTEEPTGAKATIANLEIRRSTGGSPEQLVARGAIDLSLFTQAAVSVKGRSSGERAGNVWMLVDNIGLEDKRGPRPPARLVIESREVRTCDLGSTITLRVPIRAENFDSSIEAFGFTVAYLPGCLELTGVLKGSGVSTWATVAGSPVSSNEFGFDQVRIGGFRGNADPLEGDGEIVILEFKRFPPPADSKSTLCQRSVSILAGTLVDDVEGADITSVASISIIQSTIPGDVNCDGQVTPQDAQLAFNCFLLGGNPADCPDGVGFIFKAGDMWPDLGRELWAEWDDGDKRLTPRDAQTIFEIYLGIRTSDTSTEMPD
jgi:hypothetical protein